MIKAKTVIPDRYWILRDSDGKVGNIQLDGNEYVVKIQDRVARFQNFATMSDKIKIDFENQITESPPATDASVHGYPTSHRPYNSVFDVKHQLPLWTREPRSKSWYAAGWYLVQQHNRNWKLIFCPKLILLERYDYKGPYKNKQEASQI